jgi:hypothetical protein
MPTWTPLVGKNFTTGQFRDYAHTLALTHWRPQFVVLHNTSEPRLSEWHSHPGTERMRNLESYYRDDQHWSAGPHLFVADDFIWVFSPLTGPGVHAPSWNAISLGIEMGGNTRKRHSIPVRARTSNTTPSARSRRFARCTGSTHRPCNCTRKTRRPLTRSARASMSQRPR